MLKKQKALVLNKRGVCSGRNLTAKDRISVMLLASACLVSSAALADFEIEDNNDFSSRNIFAAGVTVVDGSLSGMSLSQSDADFSFNSELMPGQVNFHDLAGLTPGESFFTAIDNTASDVDTFLGTFDEFGNNIATNDDGSPFGNGLSDALGGNVNTDGSIHLQVTGCCDDFLGTHTNSGAYDLFVFLGVDSSSVGSDIDFLSFEGLTPGEAFSAEITSANFDSTLGWFDEFGNLIMSDDDSGLDLLSRLEVIVPDNGILTFAVSGYPNTNFDGTIHTEFGEYQLVLGDVSAVPVPAAVWLFGTGLLGLISAARPKMS